MTRPGLRWYFSFTVAVGLALETKVGFCSVVLVAVGRVA